MSATAIPAHKVISFCYHNDLISDGPGGGPWSKEAQEEFRKTLEAVEHLLPKTGATYSESRYTTSSLSSSSSDSSFSGTIPMNVTVLAASSRSTTNVYGGRSVAPMSSSSRRNNNEAPDGARVAAGVAGAAIFMGAMALLGFQVKNLFNASANYHNARQFRANVKEDLKEYKNDHFVEAYKIADLRKNIHGTELRRAIWDTILTTAAVAAGVTLLAGAFIGFTPVILAGAGVLIAVSGLALFTFFLRDNKGLKKDALEIRDTIDTITSEARKETYPQPGSRIAQEMLKQSQVPPPASYGVDSVSGGFGSPSYASPQPAYGPPLPGQPIYSGSATAWGQHSTGYASGY